MTFFLLCDESIASYTGMRLFCLYNIDQDVLFVILEHFNAAELRQDAYTDRGTLKTQKKENYFFCTLNILCLV